MTRGDNGIQSLILDRRAVQMSSNSKVQKPRLTCACPVPTHLYICLVGLPGGGVHGIKCTAACVYCTLQCRSRQLLLRGVARSPIEILLFCIFFLPHTDLMCGFGSRL